MQPISASQPPFPATSALVVEGGAMRGIFASGVLDGFMQADFNPFDFAIGVSAGATNLSAYVTAQPQRSRDIIMDYATRREFFNPLRGLSGGHLTDVDWLWNYSHDQLPLQTSRLNQGIPFYAVVSRISDGEPRYIRVTPNNVHAVMIATCALPFAFRKPVILDEVRYVDGGVSDSIPVRKAWEMGARDITVVLSRPLGYRKNENPPADSARGLSLSQRLLQRAVKRMFGEDAGLWQTMQERGSEYNESLDFIANPPAGCHIRVIAPPPHFAVGRLTMNHHKLQDGYDMGLNAAVHFLQDLQRRAA
ncbi:MAG: patatin family protein [Pseudomonadota bacterium]|nr:patatin family protein [Pseudomonadota bacterium]